MTRIVVTHIVMPDGGCLLQTKNLGHACHSDAATLVVMAALSGRRERQGPQDPPVAPAAGGRHRRPQGARGVLDQGHAGRERL